MKKRLLICIFSLGLLTVLAGVRLTFRTVQNPVTGSLHFPYRSQGLSEREAAAHLLNRFSYGPTPGQVDEVVKMGLENWFLQQLEGGLPDKELESKLSGYQFLQLSNEQIDTSFPRPAKILRLAVEEGVIPKDSVGLIDKLDERRRLKDFIASKNLHQQGELLRELINQRIIRARYSNNQLQEVLTGF